LFISDTLFEQVLPSGADHVFPAASSCSRFLFFFPRRIKSAAVSSVVQDRAISARPLCWVGAEPQSRIFLESGFFRLPLRVPLSTFFPRPAALALHNSLTTMIAPNIVDARMTFPDGP